MYKFEALIEGYPYIPCRHRNQHSISFTLCLSLCFFSKDIHVCAPVDAKILSLNRQSQIHFTISNYLLLSGIITFFGWNDDSMACLPYSRINLNFEQLPLIEYTHFLSLYTGTHTHAKITYTHIYKHAYTYVCVYVSVCLCVCYTPGNWKQVQRR